MNSSAKIFLTLLAAGALGAVAIACTVSSGTSDDTNGGSSSGQTSSGNSSGSTTTDGGSDADADTATTTCTQLTYGSKIDSDSCDSCLQQNCCEETAACWNNAAAVDSKLGCEDYEASLNACDDNEDVEGCKDLTRKAAQEAIPAAYDAYLACRSTKCDSACETVAADAGAH